MSSAQGRFTSPDSSPSGVAVTDPQSWNLYSYVRNRPHSFTDGNGHWATYIHADLTAVALQGYLSPGQLKTVTDRAYTLDKDYSTAGATYHALRKPNQSPLDGISAITSLMNSELSLARPLGGDFSSFDLYHLGNALHILQDMTSPAHTSPLGVTNVWGGLEVGAIGHYFNENKPYDDWAGIGLAIRLSLAAYMTAAPSEAREKGLTADTFGRIADQRINQYVDLVFSTYNTPFGELSEKRREANRQCALGNPPACDFE